MSNRRRGESNGHSRAKKTLLLGLTTAAIIGAIPVIPAANAAVTTTPAITAVSKVVKPIYLSKTSYFNLVDVTLSPGDNGQTAAFTLSVYNGDSREIDLTDYWFRLTTASGASYSVKMQDSKITKVASKSKQFITFYATVGEQVKLSDLQLKVVKFDFSLAGYEKTIGSFKVPANYTNVVGVGSYKTLYFTNTTLNTKVSSASIGTSGDNNLATVNFVYNNVGKKAVNLSGYKYYILTSGGLMYEATPSETGDLTVAPLVREEIQLTANIPSSVKTNGWKLLVEQSSTDNSLTLPIGLYQIGFSNGSTSSTTTDAFDYSTSNGTYHFSLLQLLREPWENQDILTARIRIANKASKSATIPNITGYFYLDDQVKLDFKTIETTNTFGLNPNGYVDIDVYAKLPANYDFSKARIVVNNKIDDKTTSKAGELVSTSFLSKLPIIAADKAYTIARDSNHMTAELNNVNVYKNTTSKVYSVQMTLTSDEKRTISPTKLVAGLVNADGEYFPATITTGEGSVNPSNKALLNIKVALPQDYNTNSLQLIVGEAVADTKYATGTTVPDGYVNAVKFNLPGEQPITTKMRDLSLLPYNLSINTYTALVDNEVLNLTLDYDLVKDTTYNVYPNDRKLLFTIEGTDTNDGTTYVYASQTVGIDADSGDTLTAGTDNKVTLKANLNYTINMQYNFVARVYEVVDGSKKLIAEHPFYWFIDNDWKTQDTASSTTN